MKMSVISSASRSAVLSGSPANLEEMIEDAGKRGADIILVEGYKHANIPKLFILTGRSGYNIPEDVAGCVGIVTDRDVKEDLLPCHPCFMFDINDAEGIAGWLKNMVYTKQNDLTGNNDIMKDIKPEFTHFDNEGNARMVDVSEKAVTVRTARAFARVMVNRDTFALTK